VILGAGFDLVKEVWAPAYRVRYLQPIDRKMDRL
jgi:hypothetical protein